MAKNLRPSFDNSQKLGTENYKWSEGHIVNMNVGDGTKTIDPGITVNNGEATPPNLRYNNSTSQWEYSNDGSTWQPLGGAMSVFNEGTALGFISKLNFIGADVEVQLDGTDPTQLNIYIPASGAPSGGDPGDTPVSKLFNSVGASVPSISTTLRNISDPNGSVTAQYTIGDWTPGNQYSAFNTSTISFVTPEPCLFDSTSTTFNVKVINATGSNVANESFTVSGNMNQTTNGVTLTVSGWAADADKFKASVSVSVNMATVLTNGGRCNILITHDNGSSGTLTKEQNNIFYDANPVLPTCDAPSVAAVPGTEVIRTVSGVQYYDKGTQTTLSIPNIQHLNKNTYHEGTIIEGTLGGSAVALTINDLTGWDNKWDNVCSYQSGTPDTINADNVFQVGVGGSTSDQVRFVDWDAGTYISGVADNKCINTMVLTPSVDELEVEEFVNETYRTNIDGSAWDNTESLLNNNGLQVRDKKLVYPNEDYSATTPSGNPNYSTCTGDRTYVRKFTFAIEPPSSFGVMFEDYNFTEADLASGNVKIEFAWFKSTTGNYVFVDAGVINTPMQPNYQEDSPGSEVPAAPGCCSAGGMYLDSNDTIAIFSTGQHSDIYMRITFKNDTYYIGKVVVTPF